MRFTKMVDGVPKRENFKLKTYFDEFMNMNFKTARVDLDKDDYKSTKVAYEVLRIGVKRHGYPIKVLMRGSDIYFVRTDM